MFFPISFLKNAKKCLFAVKSSTRNFKLGHPVPITVKKNLRLLAKTPKTAKQ